MHTFPCLFGSHSFYTQLKLLRSAVAGPRVSCGLLPPFFFFFFFFYRLPQSSSVLKFVGSLGLFFRSITVRSAMATTAAAVLFSYCPFASSRRELLNSSKPPNFLHLSSKLPTGFSRILTLNRSNNSSTATYGAPAAVRATAATEKSIHDFTVKDIDGKDVSLSKFKGKVLLIVNVASRCGLTTSNYTELSHIYEKYKTQGFEILAFPCNQFGSQEPGSNSDIKQFACTRFKAEFPIFDKVDVNGPNTAPVYQFLKSSAGGFLGDLVKWNFEKFLVDKNGKVVERYPPTTSPFQIEKDVQKLLAA